MSTRPLFDEEPRLALAPGAWLLRGFALAQAPALLAQIAALCEQAPLRHMVTPGGLTMQVAMSNCGALGWVSDRRGYRYQTSDPDSGRPWPAMPPAFAALAQEAAAAAGFAGFMPDACLINRYEPGTRLSLHQDRDEREHGHPIVSVSLGLPAVFLFGGLTRTERPQRLPLVHGDVVVWGGPARLRFHGIAPLAPPEPGAGWGERFNLTLRRAG
ncbi:DNA oxidative demethylase AlkB [Roseateles violae]|uniref:DNA oxidative demethylase AlkB n=1 Tax=Roseateles violae TaxID=3058042 RepID=A0ABT8DSG0_9BURK|nr:DNA oxidative demethylase AlkB [Pelomonas sp. PFR6]MDN3921265.1 DNA oxidative demethylase AlkB [Pelomonas sp. PFR6]